MKPKPPANGLSARANRCLSTAGIPAEKEAVLHALKTGALYPYFRPTLYGKKTHQEVCRWAGLDGSFVAPTTPPSTRPRHHTEGGRAALVDRQAQWLCHDGRRRVAERKRHRQIINRHCV